MPSWILTCVIEMVTLVSTVNNLDCVELKNKNETNSKEIWNKIDTK